MDQFFNQRSAWAWPSSVVARTMLGAAGQVLAKCRGRIGPHCEVSRRRPAQSLIVALALVAPFHNKLPDWYVELG